MQQPNASAPFVTEPPIPPYNPADYAGQPAPNPYGYPPQPRAPGDNVSANDNLPRQSSVGNTTAPPAASTASNAVPYFPPPPTSPFPDGNRDPVDRGEEGALFFSLYPFSLSLRLRMKPHPPINLVEFLLTWMNSPRCKHAFLSTLTTSNTLTISSLT
jgi:hypothetical protein